VHESPVIPAVGNTRLSDVHGNAVATRPGHRHGNCWHCQNPV